jgi:peptidoglycan/LPS O-acetylase OafA/YrhL
MCHDQEIRRDREAMSSAGHPRRPEIDLLKGIAILWVLLIHAKPLGSGVVAMDLVNRAVPLFVILFGLNSRLWWRDRLASRHLHEWYASRARRILVPYWASLPVWWALALWYWPVFFDITWWLPVAHVFGYTLDIGTGWFVTLVILLVALFPLMEEAARRFGIGPVLGVVLVGEIVVAHWGEVFGKSLGGLNYMVFPPRYLGHVAFGMMLATHMDRLGIVSGSVGAVLWGLCVVARHGLLGNELSAQADALLDLPLAVALLSLLRPLGAVPLLASALVWLGLSSWGIYLGQMLVHNAAIFACGILPDLTPDFAACPVPLPGAASGDPLARWLYALVLLLGAMGFVWFGEQLRLFYGAVRRAGVPLPDLLR